MGFRVLTVFVAGAAVVSTVVPASAQPVVVSVAPDGSPGNQPSGQPVASATGRFIAFVSGAQHLVPGDAGLQDVFRQLATNGTGAAADRRLVLRRNIADSTLTPVRTGRRH